MINYTLFYNFTVFNYKVGTVQLV